MNFHLLSPLLKPKTHQVKNVIFDASESRPQKMSLRHFFLSFLSVTSLCHFFLSFHFCHFFLYCKAILRLLRRSNWEEERWQDHDIVRKQEEHVLWTWRQCCINVISRRHRKQKPTSMVFGNFKSNNDNCNGMNILHYWQYKIATL